MDAHIDIFLPLCPDCTYYIIICLVGVPSYNCCLFPIRIVFGAQRQQKLLLYPTKLTITSSPNASAATTRNFFIIIIIIIMSSSSSSATMSSGLFATITQAFWSKEIPDTPHSEFISNFILPITIKLQKELRGRRFKVRGGDSVCVCVCVFFSWEGGLLDGYPNHQSKNHLFILKRNHCVLR